MSFNNSRLWELFREVRKAFPDGTEPSGEFRHLIHIVCILCRMHVANTEDDLHHSETRMLALAHHTLATMRRDKDGTHDLFFALCDERDAVSQINACL